MAEDGGADGDPDALARQAALQAAINTDPLLSLRDANECTPLHVAIIHGARPARALAGAVEGGREGRGGHCKAAALSASARRQGDGQRCQRKQGKAAPRMTKGTHGVAWQHILNGQLDPAPPGPPGHRATMHQVPWSVPGSWSRPRRG